MVFWWSYGWINHNGYGCMTMIPITNVYNRKPENTHREFVGFSQVSGFLLFEVPCGSVSNVPGLKCSLMVWQKHGHFRGLSAQVHTTSKPLRSRSIASDGGGDSPRSISFRNPGRVEMVKFAVVDQSFRWLQQKIFGFVYKEDLHSLKPT